MLLWLFCESIEWVFELDFSDFASSLEISDISDNFIIYEGDHEFVLFKHTDEGNLRFVDTSTSKKELVEYINNMKVRIR